MSGPNTRAEKEKKRLIEQQEELAKKEFKFKRQAHLTRVKNAYIYLERTESGKEKYPIQRVSGAKGSADLDC